MPSPQLRPAGPSAMPGRRGCPVGLSTESCRRQIRDRKLSDRQTDSLRQSSTPSWARGKPTITPPGAKARRRTLTRAAAGPGRSRSSGAGLGSPRPRLPRGCLLRDAGIPGLGPRGVSRWREAVAARAHHQLRDQDGDAGSSASERRRAGGRDGERQRAAPAARGLQPREAPPTSRPSLPALRATPRPGARVPRRGGRAPASSRRLGHAGVAGMLGPSPRATPKGRGIGCGSFGGKSWAKSPGIYELSRARRFLFTPPLALGQTQHRGPASRAFT